MKARLAALASVVVLVAASPPRQGPVLPDNPLQGRLLFESRGCVLCHGITGEETGIGPDLGGGVFEGSFLDLGAALWNHVPGMSVSLEDADLPWPALTEREAAELTAFLYFLDYLGDPGDPVRGSEIFRSKDCDQCHGVGRAGTGPDLGSLDRFASPLFIAQAIWNHGPAMFETMHAFDMEPPTFGEGDLADLSAYIRQQARGGAQEAVLLAPGNPNRGRELFESRSCAICHGKQADGGGGGGPDLTSAALHKPAESIAGTMWNHASEMHEMMQARGLGWPRFTTPEVADLIAFLYFLPFADPAGDATRGETVFVSHSCADCHAAPESAPHAGPDLAESAASESPAAFVAAMWSHAPLMKEAILGEGKPWPELTGGDLRDLLAYLGTSAEQP